VRGDGARGEGGTTVAHPFSEVGQVDDPSLSWAKPATEETDGCGPFAGRCSCHEAERAGRQFRVATAVGCSGDLFPQPLQVRGQQRIKVCVGAVSVAPQARPSHR